MNILIKDIDIITADNPVKFIKGGNIGIKDGRIEFVDNTKDRLKDFRADKVIEGKDRLVMPGLVNAHTHCAMTILRNFADDVALEEWLFHKIFPAESRLSCEDIYWGSLLGIAEMIKSGTTAFLDMYMHMDHVAQAVVESGIRANLSRSPLRFIAREKGGTVHDIDSCLDFYKRWNNSTNGRIKVYIEVHSVYLFDEEAMKAAANLAKQLDTGINMHLEETAGEREVSLEKYGMNSTEICLKSGVFDVPAVAAHCVHLTDNDVKILKQKGVNVVHNPTSNLKLGSGIARIPYMLNEGINISLGTDGAASNNNLDMFEEMHLAALIHKGAEKNPILVDAQSALRMATVNGAKAIGFGRETGCIREGMKADLIILDTDKIHFSPMNNPMSAVVYSAQGSDVDTVIVDGTILMENRELKTIDEEKVKYMAKEISKKL